MKKNSKGEMIPSAEDIEAGSAALRIFWKREVNDPIRGQLNEAEMECHVFKCGFFAGLRYAAGKEKSDGNN